MKSFISKFGYWFFIVIALFVLLLGVLYLILTLNSTEAAPKTNTEKITLAITSVLIIGISLLFYSFARVFGNYGKPQINSNKDTISPIVNIKRLSLFRYGFLVLAVFLFCISILYFISVPNETSIEHSDAWEGGQFLGVLFLANSLLCFYKVWRLSRKISTAKPDVQN